MIKTQTIIVLAACYLALTGCSTTQVSYRQTQIPENDLVVMPTLVDVYVDLDQKVEATSRKVSGAKNAIDAAYYQAIKKTGADVIIDPTYEVKTSGRFLVFGGKSRASVSGYYGKYENARKLSDSLDEFQKIDTVNLKKAHLILTGFNKTTSPEEAPRRTLFGKGFNFSY